MARTVGEGGNPSLHVVTASPETLVHKRSSVCWAHFSYASQSTDMQEDRITNPYIYIYIWGKGNRLYQSKIMPGQLIRD